MLVVPVFPLQKKMKFFSLEMIIVAFYRLCVVVTPTLLEGGGVE